MSEWEWVFWVTVVLVTVMSRCSRGRHHTGAVQCLSTCSTVTPATPAWPHLDTCSTMGHTRYTGAAGGGLLRALWTFSKVRWQLYYNVAAAKHLKGVSAAASTSTACAGSGSPCADRARGSDTGWVQTRAVHVHGPSYFLIVTLWLWKSCCLGSCYYFYVIYSLLIFAAPQLEVHQKHSDQLL